MIENQHKIDDYIEAIYLLRQKNNLPVRIKEISAFLNVNKATVVASVKKLKESGYINQEHYGYILLTDEGEVAAKEIYQKHSFIREFLISVLKVSDKQADEDACKMEHVLSDETLAKMSQFLNRTKL